jgi:hypothetical protein
LEYRVALSERRTYPIGCVQVNKTIGLSTSLSTLNTYTHNNPRTRALPIPQSQNGALVRHETTV